MAFHQYLAEAEVNIKQFDATDPEHIASFLHWGEWDVRRLPQHERHEASIRLVLKCLPEVAGPTPTPLHPPAEFVGEICAHLDEHQARKDGQVAIFGPAKSKMLDAHILAMDYLCAALLGWPLETPLNSELEKAVLQPSQALARNLVLRRVNDACTRCGVSLKRWAIGFKDTYIDSVITERIVNRLLSERLWLAWADELVDAGGAGALRGNAREKFHTRMTQHSVKIWRPEELVVKKKAEGPTLTFFGHIDRAVQGFVAKYEQRCRFHFIEGRHGVGQFQPEGFRSGMLFPMLAQKVGLKVALVSVWQSSQNDPCPNGECTGRKTDCCHDPGCTFARSGPMGISRARLLLDPTGDAERRLVWQCLNRVCHKFGYYYLAQKCNSACGSEHEHDSCPYCHLPHWYATLTPGDMVDLPSFVARVKAGLDKKGETEDVSAFLAAQLFSETEVHKLLLQYQPDPDLPFQQAIVAFLNQNIHSGSLYTAYEAGRFRHIKIPKALADQPKRPGLVTFGRILLERAFPNVISNHRPTPLKANAYFVRRDVWRCENRSCPCYNHSEKSLDYYFHAFQCQSYCKRQHEHDCCPFCGHVHPMGQGKKTLSVYDYLGETVPLAAATGSPKAKDQKGGRETDNPPSSTLQATPGDLVRETEDVQTPSGPLKNDDPGDEDEMRGASAEDSLSPVQKVELAGEKALTVYEGHPEWVSEVIILISEADEVGKFPWLKALLKGVEVDWVTLHSCIKSQLIKRQREWKMTAEEFKRKFITDYQSQLYDLFDRDFDDGGVGGNGDGIRALALSLA